MYEREKQAELLTHAPRHGADPQVELQVELFCQRGSRGKQLASSDPAEDLERCSSRQPRVESEVSGKVAHLVFDPGARLEAIEPEDVGAARRRAEEAEKQADRGRLPGAVGAQKRVENSGVDVEVEIVHGDFGAVRFGEAFDFDHRVNPFRAAFCDFSCCRTRLRGGPSS